MTSERGVAPRLMCWLRQKSTLIKVRKRLWFQLNVDNDAVIHSLQTFSVLNQDHDLVLSNPRKRGKTARLRAKLTQLEPKAIPLPNLLLVNVWSQDLFNKESVVKSTPTSRGQRM